MNQKEGEGESCVTLVRVPGSTEKILIDAGGLITIKEFLSGIGDDIGQYEIRYNGEIIEKTDTSGMQTLIKDGSTISLLQEIESGL